MRAPLRFGLAFVSFFAMLSAGFEASRETAVGRWVIETLFLQPTVALLNVVTPASPVELHGRTLVSGVSRLQVTRGCEGIELLLVVVAAMGAYPAGWRDKSRGMLLGVLLAYGLGIGRLMALDYTLRYVPGLWPAMHGLLMPLVPVMLLAFYFLRWSEAGVAPLLAPVDGHER